VRVARADRVAGVGVVKLKGLRRGLVRGFAGKQPVVHESASVFDHASIVGDVHVGARSSIWFGAVLRGDVHYIRVGEETSVQDNSVIHVTHDQYATNVGSRVTIGHSVTLHGCTVGDECIIGMGATILDQAVIGDRCIVGAGALVTPGTKIPAGQLVVGAPARVKRPLTEEELTWLKASAAHYVELNAAYVRDPDWK
jgi:carbonic anhydrase/acetyltransferase-like protein (isoleucine patch superfamily)